MTHKADQILVTVTALLQDIPGLGSDVRRGRVYPHEEQGLPAVGVYMGIDDPAALESSGFSHVDSLMDVRINILVQGRPVELDSELLRIRREVTTRLMADCTLGLDFVINTEEGQVSAPDTDAEGRKPISAMDCSYIVSYRRSRTDPAQ